MKKATAKRLRGQLEEERERTLELLEDLTDERRQDDWTGTLSQPGDLADAATTRSTQGDVDSLIGTARQRLEHIEAALDRVDEGTYGTCEVCGEPIGEARLEALPFTTVCIDDVGAESSLPA